MLLKFVRVTTWRTCNVFEDWLDPLSITRRMRAKSVGKFHRKVSASRVQRATPLAFLDGLARSRKLLWIYNFLAENGIIHGPHFQATELVRYKCSTSHARTFQSDHLLRHATMSRTSSEANAR